jgi:hypothetical protein
LHVQAGVVKERGSLLAESNMAESKVVRVAACPACGELARLVTQDEEDTRFPLFMQLSRRCREGHYYAVDSTTGEVLPGEVNPSRIVQGGWMSGVHFSAHAVRTGALRNPYNHPMKDALWGLGFLIAEQAALMYEAAMYQVDHLDSVESAQAVSADFTNALTGAGVASGVDSEIRQQGLTFSLRYRVSWDRRMVLRVNELIGKIVKQAQAASEEE